MPKLDDDSLRSLLFPLPLCCFGVLAIAFHIGGRSRGARAFCQILPEYSLDITCSEADVESVLDKIIRNAPHLLGVRASNTGVHALPSATFAHTMHLALHYLCVPVVQCCTVCGTLLTLSASYPCQFFTFAAGVVQGAVQVCRCSSCGAFYDSTWTWGKKSEA